MPNQQVRNETRVVASSLWHAGRPVFALLADLSVLWLSVLFHRGLRIFSRQPDDQHSLVWLVSNVN